MGASGGFPVARGVCLKVCKGVFAGQVQITNLSAQQELLEVHVYMMRACITTHCLLISNCYRVQRSTEVCQTTNAGTGRT